MSSRPTAVDLANAVNSLKFAVDAATSAEADAARGHVKLDSKGIREVYVEAAERIHETDIITNLAISRYGSEYLRRQQLPVFTENPPDDRYYTTSPPETQGAADMTYRKLSVLTHCNTGSLATSGHGTALGIIRSLHSMNYLDHAYCTETRPYNQGARLTAFELFYEKIPATLIADSMAGALFQRYKEQKNITAVIVGADRVARNGDTANKIGTYSLAVLAKHHDLKFIVAAPTTSIDLDTPAGDSIVIENRPAHEMTQIQGPVVTDGKVDPESRARVAIAHQDIHVWNPAFDVTPHEFIDAIITEHGEVVRDMKGMFNFQHVMPAQRWKQHVVNNLGETKKSTPETESEDGAVFRMEQI